MLMVVPEEQVEMTKVLTQVLVQEDILQLEQAEAGAGGGGGDHACPAGGYTVGTGEYGNRIAGKNGSGGALAGGMIGTGGGYYTKGKGAYSDIDEADLTEVQKWYNRGIGYFNQGGMWAVYFLNDSNVVYSLDHSGDGGNPGAGGNVYYTDISKIHAYNGNRITDDNFDYNIPYYGYDSNGNELTSGTPLEVVTKPDGRKIIPAYIFAQAGTIREVHKTNQHMSQADCQKYGVTYFNETVAQKLQIAVIHQQSSTPTTGYGQGIGSGAGNWEQSNGTFQKISK